MDLEQTRISLMMLKREFMMDSARESLEQAFTPQLKKMLKDKLKDAE